jgi:hypothetical protein
MYTSHETSCIRIPYVGVVLDSVATDVNFHLRRNIFSSLRHGCSRSQHKASREARVTAMRITVTSETDLPPELIIAPDPRGQEIMVREMAMVAMIAL